jgi:hypothetical protein
LCRVIEHLVSAAHERLAHEKPGHEKSAQEKSAHDGSSALTDILVQCPRTGAPVSTGLKAEWVLLKSLPSVAVPLRCPACGQIHKWKPNDAWIGSARQPGDANLLKASRAPAFAAQGGDGAKMPD